MSRPASVGRKRRLNVLGSDDQHVIWDVLENALKGRTRVVGCREPRYRLALGVVATAREFAHESGGSLEWHTLRIRERRKKGSGSAIGVTDTRDGNGVMMMVPEG